MDYGDSSFRRGGFTLRKSNIMDEHEALICPKCSTLLTFKQTRIGLWGVTYFRRCEKCDVEYDEESLLLGQQRRIEDGDPIESSQNDTNRLLRQIEANTAKIAFWTRVVGVPVLIGLIIGALAGLTQCS
jgi:DNA-directed RNA polymerase subunit M/transcription elongation factor TFIIS